ncbi:hypothetical protein RB653_009726 [Dictyostelium firmibasis]|uniref:Uncharacterized protein n=1 Tax=Dictyostelium firmibasis TaxID=79012 RepID=A0AAN7YKD1_9MYCE
MILKYCNDNDDNDDNDSCNDENSKLQIGKFILNSMISISSFLLKWIMIIFVDMKLEIDQNLMIILTKKLMNIMV